MYKKLFFIISVTFSLFAQENLKDENIEILAQSLTIENNIVHAKGKVVVYSANYYITANTLLYDQNNSTLELFDDVNIINNNELLSYSQYMFIDLKNDINNFKPMLVLDNSNKLWFNAKNGLKNKDNFTLEESTLSSCDCKDPAWSISFSEGDYNTTKKWINTYNTTLYIQDVPVFYTPYFGFPTDDTRRTGLLKPTIGYSDSEGLLYAQPIYYAPNLNYDFEYIPQLRSRRGTGHALKYRYVDSLYSKLNIEAATFKEKADYQEEMGLSNEKHYGWNLDYTRNKLFSFGDHSDGLSIDLEDMNDVDYINTKYDTTITDNTDKYIESEIKYFYNTNNFYSDLEINLYNDISLDNNDEVLQEIPKVSFHNYSNSIFYDLFTTSVNIEKSRKTRDTGVGGDTTELYVPISYYTYLFDEYLNFSFVEEISYTNIKYTNADFVDANYGENNHVFSLYTDLIRPYKNYVHTLNFSTTYTDAHTFKNSGDIYDSSDDDTEDLDSFAITQSTNSLSLGFEQSIYNKNTLTEIVNHKLSQIYNYSEDVNEFEKYSLENDITLNFDYGSFSNRLIYNYGIEDFTTNSTTLKLKYDSYFTNFYYTNLVTVDDDEITDEDKTITYNLGFDFSKYYSTSYTEEYDLIDKTSNTKEYVFSIDDKCWAIDFKLIDSLVATTSDDPFRQKILYIELNLKQLFELEQHYTVEESN